MTIELRETEIDALIRRGHLPGHDRSKPDAVLRALYAFLDRTLEDKP
jgi:hypothetical protein